MRAIMPGYVNYYYKDGNIPAHTKESFSNYKIITVHGIISNNALLLMHKIRNFSQSLPPSIKSLIPDNAPTFNSTEDSNKIWFNKYGNSKYKSSFFYKGPLLSISQLNADVTSPSSLLSLNIYKNNLKEMALREQNKGEPDSWPEFILHHTPGIRISSRERKKVELYQAG